MSLPPFSVAVMAEFDAVAERPTWLVKFDGKPVARIVEVEGFLKRDAKFFVMEEAFSGPPPWNPPRTCRSYETERQALWAVIEDHVINKTHQLLTSG